MGAAVESSRFIVREPSRWVLTGIPVFDPRDIELDEVVGFVHRYADPVIEQVDANDQLRTGWVAPMHRLVGEVHDGLLVIEAHGGAELALDRTDVELLDRLDGWMTVAELAGRCGVDLEQCLGRVDRLVSARRVRAAATAPVADRQEGVRRSVPLKELAGSTVRRLRRSAARVARHRPEPSPAKSDPSPRPDHLVPVYSPWDTHPGPPLSLGMLTAYVRAVDGGRLNERYEIRRPERAQEVLDDLACGSGPAILLCSDYVWSLDANLALAREAIALRPELTVVHGGPSAPEYVEDIRTFFDEHGDVTHVLVNGEGESTLAELLTVWAGRPSGPSLDGLTDVAGIAFLGADGEVVRTPPRERRRDLSELPSPYLSGEYDHISSDEWQPSLTIETNRGCPYGCTFCDWGSATSSRLNMFPAERVEAELEWAARRGVEAIIIADSNFGIWSRDVDFARRLAQLRGEHGFPHFVAWAPAKNTTRHLSQIAKLIVDAGISQWSAMSPQTVDIETLDTIGRSNISTANLVALGAEYRRLGLPVYGDLIIGLPGQSYETYKADLQFMFDHLAMARSHLLRVLPNAPMNAPDYRERHQIKFGDHGAIVSTATLGVADRERVQRLQRVEIVAERNGVLRHVLRWLQWDHGVPASSVLDRIVDITATDPSRYPLLTWAFWYYEWFATVPVGAARFYREIEDFLVDSYGLERSSALRTVLAVQRHLTPEPGREFPDEIALDHDYVEYYCEALESVYITGEPGAPSTPLAARGPATLQVLGDPLDLCTDGLTFPGDNRDRLMEGDFLIGNHAANELASPLLRFLPPMVRVGSTVTDPMLERPAVKAALTNPLPQPDDDGPTEDAYGVPVVLGTRATTG